MAWLQYVVLSAELSNLNPYPEETSNAGLIEHVHKVHEIFNSCLGSHHGTLELFTGNQALALFSQREGLFAETNAIESARALQKQCNAYFTECGNKDIDCQGLKFGIACGEVFRSEIEKDEFTLLGSVIERARRICQFADCGQILVDEHIKEATINCYTYQLLEPIPVKGEAEKLSVFELSN